MLIIPAIDIRGGKCVRLFQGDYEKETVYAEDPAEMARRWIAQGPSFSILSTWTAPARERRKTRRPSGGFLRSHPSPSRSAEEFAR